MFIHITHYKELKMTDIIEKIVLMKCECCGYQEEVPLQDLIDLRDLKENEKDKRDRILCPFCLNYMYPIDDTLLQQQ